MTCAETAQDMIYQVRQLRSLVKPFDVTYEEASGDDITKDVNYRDQVVFESRFYPSNKRSLSLEVWLTSKAECAIGVGKVGSLAEMLGVSCYNSDRFIGGNEPRILSASDITWIFDAVRYGRFKGGYWTAPYFGLVSANICVPQNESKSVPFALDWVKSCPRLGKCLSFDPWM